MRSRRSMTVNIRRLSIGVYPRGRELRNEADGRGTCKQSRLIALDREGVATAVASGFRSQVALMRFWSALI